MADRNLKWVQQPERCRWCLRQESNLYLALRRRSFYPLNYGGCAVRWRSSLLHASGCKTNLAAGSKYKGPVNSLTGHSVPHHKIRCSCGALQMPLRSRRQAPKHNFLALGH